MASSASTILRLELMANGEKTGTWGTAANLNNNMIESRLDGTEVITDTGGTVTLSNVDYTNDQAKKRFLRCTGTLVSNLIIVIPNTSRSYKVINATSGAFTVTLKTASGSAKAVTQSTTAELYCDGSDNISYATPMVVSSSGAPSSASGATAATVTVTPTGNLGSTDAQAALAELQGDIDTINTALGNKQTLDSDLTTIAGLAKTKGNLMAGNGSEWSALSVGTNGLVLRAASGQSSGTQWAAGAPTGTIAPFQQTAAPTGWTKNTTHDDKAVRVVSGTVTPGGTGAFSTRFAAGNAVTGTGGSTTLDVTQIPLNGHPFRLSPTSGAQQPNETGGLWTGTEDPTDFPAFTGTLSNTAGEQIGGTGGGLGHTHGAGSYVTSLAVAYIDLILATAD